MNKRGAKQKAKELAALMGTGWKPYTYFNYEGYYYAAHNKMADVHPCGTRYTVYLEFKKGFEYTSKNPVLAYKKAMRKAEKFLTEFQQDIKEQGNG